MNLSIVKQAMEIKSKMEKAQKELKKTIVEGEAGDGVVKVTVNGQQKLMSIEISPEVADPNNVKRLEKLILKAIADTTKESQKIANDRMKEVTGGVNIPGLT